MSCKVAEGYLFHCRIVNPQCSRLPCSPSWRMCFHYLCQRQAQESHLRHLNLILLNLSICQFHPRRQPLPLRSFQRLSWPLIRVLCR
jgi:hypothetical protein